MTSPRQLDLLARLAELGEAVPADLLARAARPPASGPPPWSGLREDLTALEDEGLIEVDYAMDAFHAGTPAPEHYLLAVTNEGREVIEPRNPE